ncbi:Cytochrome P450 90B1 [Ananas comosus]|uniref:Cytochrome P450 90B1 n=1 Tax=Ananas comosus TaxID=4615 RepID=A0A199UGC1_ANACO|nr:Cytochrome P450 90B1 [Ananas comosus]
MIIPFSTVLVIIFTIIVSPTIAIVVAQSLKSYRKKRNPKFPRGPMGWPLVGSTFSFFKPHHSSSIGHFMEQNLSRYGKVFSMNFSGEMVVVSADGELNRYVLQNEMRLFRNSLPAHFPKLVGNSSLVLLMGDAYRHKKAILLAFFNKFRLQAGFLHDIERLAEGLLASWSEGGVTYMTENANKFAFYVIVKKALGLTPEDPETEQLRKEFMALYKGLYALPINLPGSTHWNALKARAKVVKTIKKKLDERKAKGSGGEEDDLLGHVIKESTYTPENICDTILGFIFGGVATSSTALCLAVYFLQNCPKAREQMREEHLECMKSKEENGKGKLTWDDYKNMEFTQNVISETLRVGNVAPAGYFIPEGTTVITYLAAVHLDSSAFENPEQFNPWRLNTKDVKKANNLLPFGGGVRQCMGSELARVELSIFLHNLILNYDWESVEPDHPVSIPLVSFPKDLPIRVRAVDHSL